MLLKLKVSDFYTWCWALPSPPSLARTIWRWDHINIACPINKTNQRTEENDTNLTRIKIRSPHARFPSLNFQTRKRVAKFPDSFGHVACHSLKYPVQSVSMSINCSAIYKVKNRRARIKDKFPIDWIKAREIKPTCGNYFNQASDGQDYCHPSF